MTNNFVLFIDESQGLADTLFSIITNCDLSKGINDPRGEIEFSYKLQSEYSEGSHEIIDGKYYSLIYDTNTDFFSESNIFNNELASDATTNPSEIDFAYPQPFNYSKHQRIKIPTSANVYNEVDLSIFSSSMPS